MDTHTSRRNHQGSELTFCFLPTGAELQTFDIPPPALIITETPVQKKKEKEKASHCNVWRTTPGSMTRVSAMIDCETCWAALAPRTAGWRRLAAVWVVERAAAKTRVVDAQAQVSRRRFRMSFLRAALGFGLAFFW